MKKSNDIITGVLQKFNNTPDYNGRIYSEEIFRRELKKLEIKYKKENRQKKIEKINEKFLRKN